MTARIPKTTSQGILRDDISICSSNSWNSIFLNLIVTLLKHYLNNYELWLSDIWTTCTRSRCDTIQTSFSGRSRPALERRPLRGSHTRPSDVPMLTGQTRSWSSSEEWADADWEIFGYFTSVSLANTNNTNNGLTKRRDYLFKSLL